MIKKQGDVLIERDISQKSAPASRLRGGAIVGTVVSISGRCVAECQSNTRVVDRRRSGGGQLASDVERRVESNGIGTDSR